MKHHELATIFSEIASLLELKGENPFRIRAYQRAAQQLQGFGGNLERLAADNRLREIPGIGPDLAAKITEFLSTGSIGLLNTLRAAVPAGVLELMRVPGMGPKTAMRLAEQHGIASLEALEQAARAHRLCKLPGFQERKEENILKALVLLGQGRARMLLGEALPIAERFLAELKRLPGVRRASTAGSVRRMCETIGDIDLLAAAARAGPVMERFVGLPWVSRVLASGATKSSVLTGEGLQVDLRVVPPDQFGAALQYFTGSKEHNVRLREQAVRRGLKVNEYGVFKERGNRCLASREETDVYAALGLAWIPPELREDRGELDLAANGGLPALVDRGQLRGDFHVHTDWSDGRDTFETMIRAGKAQGYEYMAISDHSGSLKIAKGLSPERREEQIALIRRSAKLAAPMRLLAGAEVDILSDGRLDYDDALLARLDFVVASIHSGFRQTEEQITRRILAAMQNRYVHLIAHPTGRKIGLREPYAVNLDAVIAAARDTGTALEINGQPDRMDLSDQYARRAAEAGVPVAISTDAHATDEFNHLPLGLAIARRAGLTRRHILNCRTLREITQWTKQKRSA